MTRNEAIEEALVTIAHRQLRTLDMLREQGFVFTSIGHEKGNWQHLAFTLYTELCEVDHIAREALKVKG